MVLMTSSLQQGEFRQEICLAIFKLDLIRLGCFGNRGVKSNKYFSDQVYSSRDVARFGYSLSVMAIFWISECLPLAITALLPYVFYPLLARL